MTSALRLDPEQAGDGAPVLDRLQFADRTEPPELSLSEPEAKGPCKRAKRIGRERRRALPFGGERKAITACSPLLAKIDPGDAPHGAGELAKGCSGRRLPAMDDAVPGPRQLV